MEESTSTRLKLKITMNATTCNAFIVPSVFPNSSMRSRNPSFLFRRSLVIETVQGQVSEESTSEAIARRLILLRHAKSSWEDRSLRGIEFLKLPSSCLLCHSPDVVPRAISTRKR